MFNIFGTRHPFKITYMTVTTIHIFMVHLGFNFWVWICYKYSCN